MHWIIKLTFGLFPSVELSLSRGVFVILITLIYFRFGSFPCGVYNILLILCATRHFTAFLLNLEHERM